MNKIHREKANISVAFSSGLNRLQTSNINDESAAFLQSIPKPSRFKKILRSIARKGFNLAKPILIPFASRLRQYFISGLREELIAEIHKEPLLILTKLEAIQQQLKAHAPKVVIPCADEEVIIGIEAGSIVCSTRNQFLLTTLVSTGDLEKGIRLVIQRFLCPHGIFVDIGVGVGVYTLAAAKALERKGKIFVFEALAANRLLLEKSLLINGIQNITKIHDKSPVRLDEIIPHKHRVDLIKISGQDELALLDSGKSIIKDNPQIGLIVEFNFENLKRNNKSTEQWLQAFADLELSYKVINSSSGELEDWSPKQLEAVDSINLFFARENSSTWKKAIL